MIFELLWWTHCNKWQNDIPGRDFVCGLVRPKVSIFSPMYDNESIMILLSVDQTICNHGPIQNPEICPQALVVECGDVFIGCCVLPLEKNSNQGVGNHFMALLCHGPLHVQETPLSETWLIDSFTIFFSVLWYQCGVTQKSNAYWAGPFT